VANGITRTYALHVPPAFQRGSGALVVALHGGGGSGSQFEAQSQLSNEADARGFAVAYPDGLFNSRLPGTDWQYFGNDFNDDESFLRLLVTTVSAEIQSDPKRTYLAGFSDGGRFAQRAAVDLSDSIAAIGDVGGSLFMGSVDEAAIPTVRSPVSVIILHGDGDLFCGSGTDASQEQTFNYWAGTRGNNCTVLDTAQPLCALGVATDIVAKAASRCSAGTDVQLYKFIGAGHNWYTGALNVAGQLPFNSMLTTATGVTTDAILWTFFAAHPKR